MSYVHILPLFLFESDNTSIIASYFYYSDAWQFYLIVCEKVRENEAVKMIRLKEGLIKMSEAYMMMGKKCSVLFEAQRVSTFMYVATTEIMNFGSHTSNLVHGFL